MDGKNAKTLLRILAILKQETDVEHTMTQKQILERLVTFTPEDPVTCDRRSVKRCIEALQDNGFPISAAEETVRRIENKGNGEKEENIVQSGYYYENEFSDPELRIIMDSLLFSKYIPYRQCMNLEEKIEALGNKYFKSRVRYIRTVKDNMPRNKELTYTIDILDEAIEKGRKVDFLYNSFGTDKKLHPRLGENGKPRRYIGSPYQIAAVNSRYYLICSTDKYSDLSNLRVDRITGIRILGERITPIRDITGSANGFNLPKHMAEHIYMFTGKSSPVTFRMNKRILNDVIDWFGNDVTFSDETENEVSAHVTVNLMSMQRWAVQYSVDAKILFPLSLAEAVKNDLQIALDRYNG